MTDSNVNTGEGEVADAADQVPDLRGSLSHAWGENLRRLGRLDEAEQALLESLEIMSPIFGNEHKSTRDVARSLSELYATRGRTADAQHYSRIAGVDN